MKEGLQGTIGNNAQQRTLADSRLSRSPGELENRRGLKAKGMFSFFGPRNPISSLSGIATQFILYGLQGLLFSVLWLAALESPAQACTCDPKGELADSLEKSSLVFVGRVVSKSVNPLKNDQYEVKFTVNRKLKGFEEVQGNTVLVYTNIDFEYCGYKFGDGLDYLVFATGTPAHFKTTSCSRTDVLDNVLTDVQKLIRMTGVGATK